MSNIKFSQLPNLPVGNIDATTIVPAVDGGQNYSITAANLQAYINNSTGNITAANLTVTNATEFNEVALSNIGTPILGTDAATKAYADTLKVDSVKTDSLEDGKK